MAILDGSCFSSGRHARRRVDLEPDPALAGKSNVSSKRTGAILARHADNAVALDGGGLSGAPRRNRGRRSTRPDPHGRAGLACLGAGIAHRALANAGAGSLEIAATHGDVGTFGSGDDGVEGGRAATMTGR